METPMTNYCLLPCPNTTSRNLEFCYEHESALEHHTITLLRKNRWNPQWSYDEAKRYRIYFRKALQELKRYHEILGPNPLDKLPTRR